MKKKNGKIKNWQKDRILVVFQSGSSIRGLETKKKNKKTMNRQPWIYVQ